LTAQIPCRWTANSGQTLREIESRWHWAHAAGTRFVGLRPVARSHWLEHFNQASSSKRAGQKTDLSRMRCRPNLWFSVRI